MNFGQYEVVDLTVQYSYDTTFCPVCKAESNIELSQEQALKTGISFAYCGDKIFQIVQCYEPECTGRFIFRCKNDLPALDMRDLIMMPVIHNPFIHCQEQVDLLINHSIWSPKLEFKYIPAWDENNITKEEFIKHPSCQTELKSIRRQVGQAEENHLEYFSEKHIFELLDKEIQAKKFLLRKFYPDNSLFHALLTCLAPKQQTDLETLPYPPTPEKQYKDKKISFLYLLKHYYGEDVFECIQKKLREQKLLSRKKSRAFNLKLEVDDLIYSKLHTTLNDLHLVYEQILKNDYKAVASLFKHYFEDIYHPICTKRFLAEQRKVLSQWTKKAKQGTALFVDAPMGLGKTFSIVEGLSSNSDSSAIIFMPTKRLCQDLREELAKAISYKSKNPAEMDDKIPTWYDGSLIKTDENGDVIEQYKEKYYLERGIYLFDGINKKECLKYNEIINRYNSGYYRKKDICDRCKKIKCRFTMHRKVLSNYRIIITTHFMYDFFFHNASARKWEKLETPSGDKAVVEKKDRNYFIIDEDFILSNCFQPVVMNEQKLSHFVLTLTSFFNDSDFFKDKKIAKQYFQKTDLILGLAGKTMESSIIPSIDPNFKYPKFIKEAWESSLKEQEEIIPDELLLVNNKNLYPFYVGDYFNILENAIRKGFVVQVLKNQSSMSGDKTILLPNPKQYSFKNKNLPAHVFFDGTKIDNKYIKKKLKGILIKPFEIKMKKLLWDMKVWQNINTDLPKNRTGENRPKIEKVITNIINKHGLFERYFILTNKLLKKEIEYFVSQKFPGVYFIIEYFGNLRGVNTARTCNVGIILGSLILPDTAGISMSFDFIYKNFLSLTPYPVKIFGNIWTWRGSMGTKKYKDKFLEVESFSKIHRYAEYRQALARTRYISHPVNFYIFSKDKIDDYEPFVDKIESLQYSEELFPPRPKHPKNKSEQIETVVLDWLKTNPYVSITDIMNNYPEKKFRRQTVGKHLKNMKKNGLLEPYKKYKKRYKIKEK